MKRLTLPAGREAIRALHAGDMVLLDGEITITAGLPTIQRLVECANGTRELPQALEGAALFHLGSYSQETASGGLEILYMNPTTSTRFSPLMPGLIRHFSLCMVGGKGGLDEACAAAMAEEAGLDRAEVPRGYRLPGGGAPGGTDAVPLATDAVIEPLGFRFREGFKLPLHGGLLRMVYTRTAGPTPRRPWVPRRDFRQLQVAYKHRHKPLLPYGTVGYGAAARASVYLNQLPTLDLPYVIDGSPLRAGRYIAGRGSTFCFS
jgi:tartrate dehydratase beta subunit/fumarate hydratase class I family protein